MNHQGSNSAENAFNAFVYRGGGFEPHFHRSFELVYVVAGTLSAQVHGESYEAVEGDALLVPPYVIHSLTMNEDSLVFVVVFAGTYVGSLERKLKELVPVAPKLSLSRATRDFLCDKWIFAGGNRPAERERAVDAFPKGNMRLPMPPSFLLKACIYAVADEFFASTEFVRRGKGEELVFSMLDYMEKNYLSDINLHTMADALGYDYRYLSRVFNRVLGVNFRTMLNRHRCDHARLLLTTTDDPLATVAMNSGFQSIRTFNRVFRETTGLPPSSYR